MGLRGRGREFWGEVVAEYEECRREVTHVEFTEARGVSVHAFRIWLYRIRREQERRATVPALVPVEIVGSRHGTRFTGGACPAVDAAFPGGLVLRFQAGAEPGYVAELLCRVARGLA